MFGRSQEWKPNYIPVAVCATADDVRRAVRRKAPKMPIVKFPSIQEPIHSQPIVVNSWCPTRIPVANPNLAALLFEVCEKHLVSYTDLVGPKRNAPIVHARQEAMYRLRVETKFSLPRIGRIFNRDHTTVAHGITMHAERHGLPMPDDMGPHWRVGLRRQRGTL